MTDCEKQMYLENFFAMSCRTDVTVWNADKNAELKEKDHGNKRV